MEEAEPEFEDVEGDVIARTHEIARWRETGEVAYERDFAVRLTLDDERIVRILVLPGERSPRRSIPNCPFGGLLLTLACASVPWEAK